MSDLLQKDQVFAGRYRIHDFLAQGGFGAVYIAEQLATELRVALKVLWPHVLSSQDAVSKFEQEARIAGRVNSEHIVGVIDAGFDETLRMPFLVMELLVGEDLEKAVLSRGPMSPEQVVVCMRQTASGLDKAHGYVNRDGLPEPIVHRDLKPENLFLTHRDDGSPCIKILDFGIAKVLSSSTKVSQEVKGTPLYMAYEQGAGGAITPRTDIWALGLIAFFMLTGRCYWKTAHLPEASLTQLFGEVLSLPIVPPTERARELGIVPTWPAGFEAWFLRCVNRDAHKRFSSAGEASAALAKALGIPNHATTGGGSNSLAQPVAPAGVTLQSVPAPPPDSLAGTDHAVAIGRSDQIAVPKKSHRGVALAAAGTMALLLMGLGLFALRGSRGVPQASAENSSVVPAAASTPAAAEVEIVPTPSSALTAPSSTRAATADAAPDVVLSRPSVKAAPPTPTLGKAKLPEPSPTPKPTQTKPSEDVYGGR